MVGSIWPHHLLIEGPATSGRQDPDTGDWIPGTSGEPIYNGGCDGQEDTSEGVQIVTSGQAEDEGTRLKVYLEDESIINDLDIGMVGTLTRGTRADRVKISKIRLIDGMIEVTTV